MGDKGRPKDDGPPREASSCPIVGVGASAGGLAAFRELLSAIPARTPFSFVFVQHLSPERPTHLAELLAEVAKVPVELAADGAALHPGRVYVIPEGRVASLESGMLRLRPRTDECRQQPIDSFFTSLALHEQSGACGVILSGLGSDGAQGLREIAAAGGLTFVQDPATAEFDSMPRAASRVADFIGSPEEIAERLHERSGHPHLLGAMEQAEDERAYADILALTARELGMDFSHYKPTTVRRRIGRRAMLRNLDTLEAYLGVLRSEPAEIDSLVCDLLINVTQFFRDPEVFAELRDRVFPELLAGKTTEDTIRIWVPACSTGEEVYSILITLLEALGDVEQKPPITIFGSDASDEAIRDARAGIYPEGICGAVSPERLSRFFQPVEGGLQVAKALREMCIFARQDITRDTPFSRIDLISMRNLLIYFEPALQRKVLAIAHFALVPQGFLVLGTSETPDSEPRLFETFDKQRHVYRRKDVAPRLPIDVTGPARISFDALAAAGSVEERPARVDISTEADQLTLAAFAPPRVVIDADGHILHFFGDASPYLELAEGRATLDLLELARPALALDVKDAVEAARGTSAPANRHVTFSVEGQARCVSIEVLPLAPEDRPANYLVAFVEVPCGETDLEGVPGSTDITSLYEAREERLRRELISLRGSMRTTSEEKDLANQALRGANEEVRSSNEELQSINEELETAKEELQSANEELSTVNDELRQRNADLTQANDDLANFATSTDIPLVMVDRELRVRRFTAQAERVIRVEPSDLGRLLQHLRLRVAAPDLEPAVRGVIGSEQVHLREVRGEDGRWYSLQIRPYHSSEGRVEGAVLSFIDIDDLKRSAQRSERRARLSAATTDIDERVASTLDLDEILHRALDDSVRALDMDLGTIEIREGESWVVRYQTGSRPEDVGMRLNDAEAPIAARAARAREPVAIEDVLADEGANASFVRTYGVRAVLAVPLVLRGEVTGCILLHSRGEPRRFDPLEIDFGRRLATSVSLALENARLLQDERKASRLSGSLNKVNEILMSALTRDEVLARLVGEVSEIAGADKCLVIEVRGDEYTVTHLRNVRDDLVVGQPKPGSYYPAFAIAATEHRPVLVEDNWSDPRTNKDFVAAHDVHAFQLMPLVVDDEAVAVIAFAYDAPRVFDAEDQRFAERMSTAMSLAMRNAVLFEDLREARERLAADLDGMSRLREIGALFVTEGGLEAVLDKIIEAAVSVTAAEMGNIQLLDPGSGILRIEAQRGFDPQWVDCWDTLCKGKGTCAMALERGERVIVEDVADSPVFDRAAVDAQLKAGVHAVQSTPLLSRSGRPLGVFSTHSRQPGRPDDRALRLLDLLARQAADIIERTQAEDALRKTHERAEELAMMLEASSQPFAVGGLQGELLQHNLAYEQLTGYTHDEMHSVDWSDDLTPPEYREFEAERLAELIRTGEPARYEKEYVRKDGSRVPVELLVGLLHDEHGEPAQYYSFLTDITARKRTESRVQGRLRLLHAASDPGVSLDEVTQMALDEIEAQTGSSIGFYHFLDEDQETLTLQEWSSNTVRNMCTAEGKGRHYPVSEAGVWVDCIRERRPVIHNDYALLPGRKGLPGGHAAVTREMVVPILRGDRIVAIIGVGNKPTGYGADDIETALFLGDFSWEIVERKRAEAESMRRASILAGIRGILEAALTARSDVELGAKCLAVAGEVTGSALGFVGQVGPDGLLHDIALSDAAWKTCSVMDRTGHRQVPSALEIRGLYGRVLDEGKTFLTNAPAEHPDSAGVPEGHPALTAFLGAPLVRGGRVIGIVALANREGGYRQEDADALEALTPTIVEAFERKRAERALRESQHDLKHAQAVASVGSWRLDTGRNELVWSDETYRMFGVPADTPMTYEAFLAATHPDDRAYVDDRWAAALKGEPYDIEHRIVVGETVKWVREQAELELDDEGSLLGGFGTVQDITGRKAEQLRLEKENREIAVASRILELFVQETADALYEKALDVMLETTGSTQGVFGYMDERGDLVCPTMTRVFDECEMDEDDKCVVYQRHKWTGLWGKALAERGSFYTNDPATVPEGHVPIQNNLATAIVFQGETIGLINLADKDGDYTEDDRELVDGVAERIAPVLYAWIQQDLAERERHRAEAQRDEYLNRLVKLLDVSTDVLSSAHTADMLQRVADAARQLIPSALAVCGHGFAEGAFRLGVTSCADDAPPCPPGKDVLGVERGGTYLELIEGVGSVRLNEEELLAHPRWRGLPEGHAPLRGLLGASLADEEGRAIGLIMLSDKEEGDYTQEDEIVLLQLASIASLGLRQLEARREVDAERSRLRTIIDTIPIGFSLLGPDGAVLESNAAVDRIAGGPVPRAESVEDYRAYKGFHRGTDKPIRAEEWPPLRVIATGERVEDVVDIERLDGTRGTIRLEAIPLKDKSGGLSQIVAVTEDVTDRVQRGELNQALNAISATVSATLEVGEILHRFLVLSAEALGAETADITLRQGGRWVIKEVYGLPESVVGTSLSEEQAEATLLSDKEQRPIAVSDAGTDPRVDAEAMRSLGIRSFLTIPLVSQGRLLGKAAYHHRSEHTPFSDAQVDFATRLTGIVSLALDNAGLYERERTIADTLQEAILTPPMEIPGVETAFIYKPASASANVGGDFYDVFPVDEDHVAIVVGDVSGKGLPAARLTSLVRDGIRAYAVERREPADVLERLNSLVHRSSSVESFATLFLGMLDRHTGLLRYTTAAHPPCIVLASDRLEQLASPGMAPIGAFEEVRYESDESELRRGDVLVLYTDGVTEARRDKELFGEERLVAALDGLRDVPLGDLPESLLAEVLRFTGGTLRDDTVVMCVRFIGSAED